MKRFLFASLLLLLISIFSLSAYDWGFFLDQSISVDGYGGDSEFSYTGTAVPWFYTPLSLAGIDSSFYLSAGVSLDYEYENWAFIPELMRTELSLKLAQGMNLKIGRINYSDPLGFIANGLFDGASFSLEAADKGTFEFGLLYTGLLYKKSAYITMTSEDLQLYYATLDYGRFNDTYFAPRRLVMAANWNDPYLAEWLNLNIALIGQFDLTGNDTTLHSQYLAAKADIPVNSFVFNLGFSMGLLESSSKSLAGSEKTKLSFAGELGIVWMPPTSSNDRLALTGRFSSGTLDDAPVAAFVPITTELHGDVLQAKLSGLSMLRLDYTIRFREDFLLNLASSYFILSDLGTYGGLPAGKDGHFLGNEFYGKISWAPFSDLRFNLGGGVFLPSMGNASRHSETLWQIGFNVVVVFF